MLINTLMDYMNRLRFHQNAVADPGFSVGGAHLVGGADSRGGYVSKNLYVYVKESGP